MSQAAELIRRFEQRRPLAVRLAEAVSLAVLVDPPLLRRARRLFVPEADAGTEADLWLSPLVRTRSPDGLVFPPEVAQELRRRLHRSGRLDDAWEMTCELHGHLPPALQLEEEIAWLSVSEDPGAAERIEELLRSALAALVAGERRGLAHWAAQALPRLPSGVRVRGTARMLEAGAHLRLGGDARPLQSPDETPDWASWVAPADLPRVPVRVRLLDGAVELDSRATDGNLLQLPQTDPLVVDLIWGEKTGEGPAERRAVQATFRKGEAVTVPGPRGQVCLRTLLNEWYDLHPSHEPARALRDWIIDFSEERARHRPFFGWEKELSFLETMALSSGVIVVAGPTGVGKTAFLARFLDLCEQRGHLPPHHFFRRGDPRLEDIAAAERSLIAQIAARFPEIAPVAEGRNLRGVLEWLREQDLLSPEPLVLVLDGLDQIRTRERDDLRRLLILDLPTVVVVVSSQPDGMRGDLAKHLVLTPSEEELRPFWEHHGPSLSLGPAEIEIALGASEGNFGLAQVLRRWLETGSRDFFQTGNEKEAFQQIWEKLGEIPGQDMRNIGLGVLAAARAPLPDSLVLRLLGPSRETFAPLVRIHPAPFPEGEPVSELLEEVLRELIADRIDLKTSHWMLAQAITSEVVPNVPSPQVREYGLRHGIAHWLEAGEPEQAYQLCTDTQFLIAGCRDIGPETVRRSLEEWLERNPLLNVEIMDLEKGEVELAAPMVVQLVHDVIEERALLLQDDPEALPGLLYDRFRVAGWSPSEFHESLRFPLGLPSLRRKNRAVPELHRGGPSRHRGSVVGCAFTFVEGPNTDIVLSWSVDGTLNLWRADGGELISTLVGHTGEITGCVLPGEHAVSSSRDGTLRLWYLPRPSHRRGVLAGHEGAVLGVAPIDDRRVVSWSEDRTIRVWDIEEERELLVLRGHDRAVTACAVVGEDWLVSGSEDATVRLWNRQDGRLLRTYRGHQAAVTRIVAAPGGRQALSCSLDRTVKIWPLIPKVWSPANAVPNPPSEEEMRTFHTTLEGHSLGVLGVALSRGGKRLASWSYDRTVRVWECPELADPSPELQWGETLGPNPSAHLLSTLTGHQGAVLDCAFLADMRLVSCSADRTLHLWMASTGEQLDVFEGHERAVRCLAIEPRKGNQPERIASGSDDRTLRLWSSKLGVETTSPGGASEEISVCLAATQPGADHESVLFGNRSGNVEIRGVGEEETQEQHPFRTLLRLPLQGGVVDDQHYHVVTWGWDGNLIKAQMGVLDLRDLKVNLIEGHEGTVLACAFTTTSDRLLSASMDSTICIWRIRPTVQFDPIGLLQGHSGPVSDIRVGLGDQIALSASWDGTLRLWGLGGGYPLLRVLEGHTDRVLACAIDLSGGSAVSASADRTLRLWFHHEGRTIAVLSGHDDEVTGCAFTQDGSRIISRSLDGTLGIWDAQTGALLFRLRGHTDWVNAFALDEDRNVLYSCSEDETVRAWDLATGEKRGVVYGVSPFRSLAATHDGVCAGDEAGNFWVLEYGEGELREGVTPDPSELPPPFSPQPR